MRLLVDECTGPAVARLLRSLGHDVFSVYEQARGLSDDQILAQARAEARIIVTNDKDFGEKAFRDGQEHAGIVLLRLDDETKANKVRVVERLIAQHAAALPGNVVVVTETAVRISQRNKGSAGDD